MTNMTDLTVDSITNGGQDIPAPSGHLYVAAGAIAEKHGCVTLAKTSAGAMAMTVAVPVATTDDYKILHILNAQAQSNTVAVTGGTATFGGSSGTDYDVATFGAAVGNTLTLMAYQGNWYVIGAFACTLA